MAASLGRSPLAAYLAMAAVALLVVTGLTLIAEPAPEDATPPTPSPTLPLVVDTPAPSLERDFLTTVLGRPRRSDANRYCNASGCCPTWRTTFGTTAPTEQVVALFEVRGYVTVPGDRAIVRPGPFPAVRWTAELDVSGRREWRRVEVSRGTDVRRPAWPTVFVESSVACGTRNA
jgi:hypothetical protein